MPDTAEAAIQQALFYQLRQNTLSPSVFVSYPDVKSTPPNATPGVRWIRVRMLPAPKVALGIDPSSFNQVTGIMQLDSMTFPGGGSVQATRYAQSICQWFARGTTLVTDDQAVTIIRPPSIGQMLQDDPWMFIPVSVFYFAYTRNPA